MLSAVVRTMRPYQWTKNLLVLAALIFSEEALNSASVVKSLLAFLIFCLSSSGMYVFNDLLDLPRDRVHPDKRNRPLASGQITVRLGWVLALLLTVGALVSAWALEPSFFWALFFYVALTLAYTLFLKNVPIIDVLAIALGFVARAIAGALVIDVVFSNWLIVCTLFLSLFLALGKRRHELATLQMSAKEHRSVLDHYSVDFLDQLILIVTGATILTYTIYTCSPEVVERFQTDKFYMTLPLVIYGLFRYLHLVHRGKGGGDPSGTLLRDWPTLLTVAAWAIICVSLIYFIE